MFGSCNVRGVVVVVARTLTSGRVRWQSPAAGPLSPVPAEWFECSIMGRQHRGGPSCMASSCVMPTLLKYIQIANYKLPYGTELEVY